jgi:hypothetical protein
MANLPVANCARVEVRWLLQGQQCENTFAVHGTVPWTEGLLLGLNTLVTDWIVDFYAPMVSDTVFFSEIESTGLDAEDGPQVTTSVSGTGGGGTTALPNEASFCVIPRSGLTGRSRRGRWFMPPPLLADRDGANAVTVTYANLAKGALNELMSALSDASQRMGVISRIHNGAVRTPPLFTPYTNATYVNLILDSQRNRRPGNGA